MLSISFFPQQKDVKPHKLGLGRFLHSLFMALQYLIPSFKI